MRPQKLSMFVLSLRTLATIPIYDKYLTSKSTNIHKKDIAPRRAPKLIDTMQIPNKGFWGGT